MNAIEYLIGRAWPKAWKVGGALLLGLFVSWMNFKIVTFIPGFFPHALESNLATFAVGCLSLIAGLVAFATLLGVSTLVPIFVIYRCTNLLRSWIRQRVVEELLCAGMPPAKLLDGTFFFALRWWAIATAPTMLAGCLLVPDVAILLWPQGFIAYGLAALAMGYLSLFVTTWSGLSGGKLRAPMALAGAVVLGVPFLALMVTGMNASTLLFCGLYLTLSARQASIYALENSEQLTGLDHRFRRAFQRPVPERTTSFSENPILAREAMRGADSSDLFARGIVLVGFLLSAIGAVSLKAPGMFAVLLVGLVSFNCYRAASKMSQIVTEEVETSTLETIRSTPMGSEQFLNGWLIAVLRPMLKDTAGLLLAITTTLLVSGQGLFLLHGASVMAAALCFALPIAGAYVGASIAGQSKTRSQIAGQLILSFGAFVITAVPQAMVSTTVFSLPFALGGFGMVTFGLCWLMSAGAKKSLNRVFLPQK